MDGSKNVWLVVLLGALLPGVLESATSGQVAANRIQPFWQPLLVTQESGLLAERVKLWRQERLWHMLEAEDDYLLSGFDSHPGRHPWQGEHVGKWLHAATLAYEQTRDEKLMEALQDVVKRLIATQEANGYLGTYGPDTRFTAMPENVRLENVADDIAPTKKGSKGGWDTWTFRYNLYGLLTYERFHPDPRVVEACRKMADLLIEVYGDGKYDLTKYGTRQGISATTLLESIAMLYGRTQDEKYLRFAEHIVAMSEKNPKLRLMGNMLEEGSVVDSGDGKAYQLMANLLGYLLLYQHTGDERYLKTVLNGWQTIRAHHLDVTGGPWGRHMPYNSNCECFAHPQDYDPAEADVETCSTTTWIQLNLHLLELTGEARYAAEAERAMFNSLLAAQNRDGIDWCYYTRSNQHRRPYKAWLSCCASSGPRALEMFNRYQIGVIKDGISLASLTPCTALLPDSMGGAKIQVTGNYPVGSTVKVLFEEAGGKEFALEFRDPFGSRLKSAHVNAQKIAPQRNGRGFYRIHRAWKTGDRLGLEFEPLLKGHLVAPVDKPVWVAFTFGPWALAQTVSGSAAAVEPFVGKDPKLAADPSHWLEPIAPDTNGAPQFRIKGAGIVLGPYYDAGSRETGPRTYFRLVSHEEIEIESKPPGESADERRPNVVFFLVDDLGWADLGCYGSRFHDTPNIDSLAREGARFTDAYATCHVCSPSRASIMTGKYPARLKLTDWLPGRRDFPFQKLKNAHIRQALPLQETTLAEALKQHGYRTAHFGKWHLGEAPAGPLRQGFDIQVPQDWFKGWPKAGYHYPFALDGLSGKKGDYLTDRLTDEALKFIHQNRDRPFFLFLSHFAVHDPIQGRSDLVRKYEDRRAKLPADKRPFVLEGNPDAKAAASSSFTSGQLNEMIDTQTYAEYRVLPNRLVKVKQRQDNPQFAAMVESVDQSLGRVLARLKALGLEQNTIIIFTSDNGGMAAANFGHPDRAVDPAELDAAYSTSNLPLRGAKGWLYEGGIRVPLIIKWPGQVKAGLVIDEPVTGTDYYPTILDMAVLPKLAGQHVDGTSLKPLFHGENGLGRDALYWHFPHYSNHGMQSPGGAIRRGRYKLLEYFEHGTVQLFDLQADPGEQNDLAESRPEMAGQLLEKLRQWRKAVGAEMMEPNPDYNERAAHAEPDDPHLP
jgi:arylsulfatase A-like enzyme/DUF1680 family protein